MCLRCPAALRDHVQRHGGGIRDIEDRQGPVPLDAVKAIAGLRGERPEALAFGAENQGDRARKLGIVESVYCGSTEADDGDAILLQLREQAGEVLGEVHRHVFQGARGRLCKGAVEWRTVAPGHDQASAAEYCRRAQNGADVMRVGDLIEDHERAPGDSVLQQRIERRLRQVFGFEREALMDRVGAQHLVELARGYELRRYPPRFQRSLQPAGSVLRRHQLDDAAGWIGERRFHGVETEQRYFFPVTLTLRRARVRRLCAMAPFRLGSVRGGHVRPGLEGRPVSSTPPIDSLVDSLVRGPVSIALA